MRIALLARVIGMGLFKWASLTPIDSVELAPSNNALSANQSIGYDHLAFVCRTGSSYDRTNTDFIALAGVK